MLLFHPKECLNQELHLRSAPQLLHSKMPILLVPHLLPLRQTQTATLLEHPQLLLPQQQTAILLGLHQLLHHR